MPFTIPTLTETRGLSRDAVIEALRVDGLPGNSPASILAESNAGLAFLTLQSIARQAQEYLPDQAGEEMLQRWASIFLPGGRKAATYASIYVSVTGSAGTVVPQATQLLQGEAQFETLTQVVAGPSPVEVGVRALAPGAIAGLAPGVSLSLVQAISGLDSSAAVTRIASPGTDPESIENLRTRILARIRMPPQGGAAHDYEAWALEVPGVTRAWASPAEQGPGSIAIRFMMDDLRAANFGLPNAGDIAAVRAHLEERRPVAVQDMHVGAPQREPVVFAVRNLVPNTTAAKNAFSASVRAMIDARAAPARSVGGRSVPAQTIFTSWIAEAGMAAANVESFDLIMDDAVMPAKASLAVLGSPSFG